MADRVVFDLKDMQYVEGGVDSANVIVKAKLGDAIDILNGMWSEDGDTPLTGPTAGEWIKSLVNQIEELAQKAQAKLTQMNSCLDATVETATGHTRDRITPNIDDAAKTIAGLTAEVQAHKGR